MKCYRILYKPDNTAFMVWAENKQQALDIAHEKNKKELPTDQEIDITDYHAVEFTPGTNSIGILTFYDIYETFERMNVPANDQENNHTATKHI